jgi:hypothetical protein
MLHQYTILGKCTASIFSVEEKRLTSTLKMEAADTSKRIAPSRKLHNHSSALKRK